MLNPNIMERRLQLAGIILILGLIVEGLCLTGSGAIPFVVFVSLGGLLIFIGIVAYLLALVRTGGTEA